MKNMKKGLPGQNLAAKIGGLAVNVGKKGKKLYTFKKC